MRTRTVLEWCKLNNITILRKKFEIGTEIEFAGHIISDSDINLPLLKKFQHLHASEMSGHCWLGLANQLGSLILDLTHMISTIHPLLKKRTAWNWLTKHQATFYKIKDLQNIWHGNFEENLEKILRNRFYLNTNKERQHATHTVRVQQPNTHTSKMQTWMHGRSIFEDFLTLKSGPITNPKVGNGRLPWHHEGLNKDKRWKVNTGIIGDPGPWQSNGQVTTKASTSRSITDERIAGVIKREDIRFVGVYKICIYIPFTRL